MPHFALGSGCSRLKNWGRTHKARPRRSRGRDGTLTLRGWSGIELLSRLGYAGKGGRGGWLATLCPCQLQQGRGSALFSSGQVLLELLSGVQTMMGREGFSAMAHRACWWGARAGS